MLTHQLYVQSPSRQRMIHRGIVATANDGDHSLFDAAVAYATEKGCRALVGTLGTQIGGWSNAKKRWLLSIDWGITEPEAIDFLAGQESSEVRIARASEVLRAQLKPNHGFHSKMYAFRGDEDVPLGLFSTSANLTLKGLYLNDEQGTSSVWRREGEEIEPGLGDVLRQLDILESQFESAEPLSDALFDAYIDARENQRPTPSEDEGPEVEEISRTAAVTQDLSKAAALATARCLWVEVGRVVENRGPGNPGNQIDLQQGTRVFFGFSGSRVPRNHHFGEVRIRFNGRAVERAMRHGDNNMDKLNLPIPGEDGPDSYEHTTLLFCQVEPGVFDMTVAEGAQAVEWRSRSREQGTFFTLQSGREFGVFD